MKISSMLDREDFYRILQDTLRGYYGDETEGASTTIYLYPHLNAGITRRPSKEVKRYLACEYRVKGCVAKRLAVKTYLVLMLNGFGLFAAKKMRCGGTENKITNDTLIYPCNRKIRIFDFHSKCVDVITKAGFAKDCIQKEILFRTQNRADFIWPLVKWNGDGYRETIIKGIPLARYKGDIGAWQRETIRLLDEFAANKKRRVKTQSYIQELRQKIHELLVRAGMPKYVKDINAWTESWGELINADKAHLQLTFSHGDLQSGNIWIEEKSNRIIIIDWESWDLRSADYDKIVLYTNIRQTNEYEKIYEEVVSKTDELSYYIFVLEDIVYKLNEMAGFPEDVMKTEYEKYFQQWKRAMERLSKEGKRK